MIDAFIKKDMPNIIKKSLVNIPTLVYKIYYLQIFNDVECLIYVKDIPKRHLVRVCVSMDSFNIKKYYK